MTKTYLTRAQVAELYPISTHTLAKLASEGRGPPFYKPTDKCLYRPADVEAWIEAALVHPLAQQETAPIRTKGPVVTGGGRGRVSPKPTTTTGASMNRSGRKSLPPSPNSWLLRDRD